MMNTRIGITAILLFLSVFSWAALAADGQPKAVVPKMIQSFGPVVEGEQVVREFTVRNEGDAELVIERVGTG